MKVGFGSTEITPSGSVAMDGYGSRIESSRGVHAPLYARAAVFEEDVAVLVLVLDILAVDGDLVRAIRAAVTSRTGILGQHIMVAATHTHAGPKGGREHAFGNDNAEEWEGYRQYIVEQAGEAAHLACQAKEQAVLKFGRREVELFASNRRSKDGCVEGHLSVLVVERDGRPLGVLFNYPCHPTILDAKNLVISPDFPGYAVEHVQRFIPHGMFFNGAAGDISTRFTRRSASINEAQARGAELAEAVLDSVQAARPVTISHILGSHRAIELPVRPFDVKEAEAQLMAAQATYAAAIGQTSPPELRQLEVNVIGAGKACKIATALSNKSLVAEIQLLEFGPIKLFSIPGELFCSIGKRIKALGPKIEIVGYGNGYIGYIPSREAFRQGGYELFSSLVGPDAEEVIIDTIRSMGGF